MAVELCILASGSGGNSTIVRTPGGAMLIDIGIGPRTTAKRLDGTGLTVKDITAVCLTHLDRDHFNINWLATIVKQRIRVHCHERWVRTILRLADDWTDQLSPLLSAFDGHSFSPLADLKLRPVALAHDEDGSHGFLIEGFGCRVGYATDLGHVSAELLELFDDLDLLALESNYDPKMELDSARPWFLKRRIMGGSGHLSNEQALSAIRHVLDRCEQAGRRLPAHIVLLHRSRECNCPKLVRNFFSKDARIAPRLTLAEQFERTGWLRAKGEHPLVGEQLGLGWE